MNAADAREALARICFVPANVVRVAGVLDRKLESTASLLLATISAKGRPCEDRTIEGAGKSETARQTGDRTAA